MKKSYSIINPKIKTGLIFFISIMLLLSTSIFAGSYIVIAKKKKFNNRLKKQVEALGGTITKVHSKLGIAFVISNNPSFKNNVTALSPIKSVVKDLKIQWISPDLKKKSVKANSTGNPPNSGDDDFFFDLQWGHDAIDAPEAWNMGATGAGVRVAVLDDGIDSDHPDIAPNLNISLSKSFVVGEPYEYVENYPGDPFSHGTHTSGTILAANNGYGTIGVAPEAELIMVKVLSSLTGSGYWSWIINGIVYATDINADVINMSIGGWVQKTEDNLELIAAMNRATYYAYSNGTTVFASSGNDGLNTDDYPGWLHMPSMSYKVQAITATAPQGWAVDNSTNLDLHASYSNYGSKNADFAAPGGDFSYVDKSSICTIGGLTHYCYVFDFVFSTGSAGGWYWSIGTSMASPHAAGVAALIIGEAGGSLHPHMVQKIMRSTADDLGPTWKDNFYGYGRVNAYKAVKRMHRFAKEGFVEELEAMLPVVYNLEQNYPNPFNPTTTINFSIPEDNFVSIKVYDMLGRLVTDLVSEDKAAGFYSTKFDATNLSSGMYFYTIQAGNFYETKKLLLQK